MTVEEANGALAMLDKAEKWLSETELAQVRRCARGGARPLTDDARSPS